MHEEPLLTEMIAGARDVPQVGEVCRQLTSALGFEYFLYGLRLAITLSRPCQFILSGYPPKWRARYDEAGYMIIDPVLARGASTVVPFVWDEVPREKPMVRQLFEEASQFGLCHGLTVPMHCANGEFGLMSFARREYLPQGSKRTQLFQKALWLCANVQERMRQIVLEPETHGDPKLSARERDCLRLAAQGLSGPAISARLGIAESTVVFHLNSAERKFGVRNRGHAIARAVALGAITPEGYPAQIASSEKLLEFPP